MFVVYGIDGTVRDASASYCALVGLALDEVVGRPWPDLVEGERELGWQQLRYSVAALATQQVLVVDMPTRIDGEALWLRWTEWAVRDDDGRLVQVQSTAVDVTDLHVARAAVTAGLDAIVAARALGRRDVVDRLHDGALQQLTAARWAIEAGDSADAATLVESAIGAVTFSMDTLSPPDAPVSRRPPDDPFWRSMMMPSRGPEVPSDVHAEVVESILGAVALVSATGSVWLEPRTRLGMFDERSDIDLATFLAALHPDDREVVAAAVVTVLGGEDARVQWRFREPVRGWHHMYTWLTPLADVPGRPRVAVALTMDITDVGGDSLRDVMAAQLAERQRVARDLHDDVLQQLAGLRWALVAADVDTALLAELDAVDASVRGELLRLRSAVDRFGPVIALQQLVDATLTPCSLELPAELDDLPAAVADQLWRVAREALRNVDRHARAAAASLVVQLQDDHVSLEILDDGEGLAPGRLLAAARSGHLGVATMRDAAVGQGGTFELGPRRSGGTRLFLTLPLDGPLNGPLNGPPDGGQR